MTKEKHREIHRKLHKALDQLVADFINHTEKLPSKVGLLEFMKWAFDQTQDPTETFLRKDKGLF